MPDRASSPNDRTVSGERSDDVPYRPRAKTKRGSVVDRRLRRALPAPAYSLLLGGFHAARTAVGRNPGRGRVLPDFVILGAAKAGTTSLFGWLSEHPYVRAPTHKEINFFSYHAYRGSDWYRQHFPLERERRAFTAEHGRPFLTGEASPSYLLHYRAPERLRKLLPEAKLIVQLRDPVARAYSQFQMRRRDGDEPLESFAEAAAAEEGRLAGERARMLADRRYSSLEVASWSYLMRSRYAEQLERWFEHFPREQFHIFTLEELAPDPQPALDRVLDFLDLPRQDAADFRARFAFDYEPLSPELRTQLEEYFRPHNERLYRLLNVDFGWGSSHEGASPATDHDP